MNPRVVLLLTRVVLKGLQRCDGTLSLSDYSAYLSIKERADERTRTAYPCSLRVCGQWLLSVAGVCKYRISKGLSILSIAPIDCIESLRPALRFRVPLGEGAHELEVLR